MKISLRVVAAATVVASSTASPASKHDSSEARTLHDYHLRLQQQEDQVPIFHQQDPPRQSSHYEHWWNPLSTSTKEHVASLIDDSVDYLNAGVDKIVDAAKDIQDKLRSHLTDAVDAIRTASDDVAADGHHHSFDQTIYQLISLSNYTTKFHKLVDEYPDIVEALNSTSGTNYTLFVPIDAAFDDIPDHHKDGEKPSKEFIESVLKYHIGLGEYPAKRLLTTHTLPTAYDEEFLGGEPQRLRTSVGLTGVRVNFYSKVVAANIGASNGVIHGVRSILVPPPFLGGIINLFPSKFSTLSLAYAKTGFGKYVHSIYSIGNTVFAPSNAAFAGLGVRTNAFLFNTEKGLKYLNAILKYHIAPNATLYSDAFYDKTHEASLEEDDEAESWGTEHFDLKTLLGDSHIGVDIATLAGFKSIRVNGFAHISVADAIGKNGVLQVVDKVLLPPRKHSHDNEDESTDDIEVEDLIERLADYVE